ncbi:nucleolar MIF4G domain-containing protein 1 [Cocos nucifera]|uniref:Nucleolar MIF4G domain-containing protein 1 n=1 Tax=Cocos nucifera TaxID=13894 RepID=A0A8K0IMC9_COCNU|nr:nucleolar MIF4G domain-containing protein 1 [Cocos nucifera]
MDLGMGLGGGLDGGIGVGAGTGGGGKKKKKASLDSKPLTEDVALEKKSKKKLDSLKKMKRGSEGKSKTKFQEFLDIEMGVGMVSAEEDLEMERRLAKKLKVKNRKLGGADDELNMLLEGLPSFLDSVVGDDTDIDEAEEDFDKGKESVSDCGNGKESVSTGKKKRKRKKSSVSSLTQPEGEVAVEVPMEDSEMDSGDAEQLDTSDEKEPHVEETSVDAGVKYVAPHLRARANAEPEEFSQVRRRVRGLLNKLSESNVESITEDVATLFQSVPRSVGCQIIGEEVVASCSGGPRGSEQYAAVFATFVAGLACLVGIDFSAKLLASLAKSFEDEYLKEDGLSLRNLTLLLSCMCIFGVCSSDLLYDLLSVLTKRLTELDVSAILTILQCCGMKLRSDDPTAMKDFVLGIQNRVNELKSLSESKEDGKSKINSKRMEFMLEMICDIKNNKKRPKEDTAHHTRMKKWLQKLRAEDVLLRGLKWSKLLDPDKKGLWWLTGDVAPTTDNVEDVPMAISKEVLEAQKLVQLAAAQRMNTDLRRAIFCIIMSGEDYLDAFEKLLRLDLSGKQDREIMRVLVDCCLQEKVFNKYYTVLASKLCSHDKNHKFSLQYCLWDHFRELESMELNRSMNLARFVAEMLSSFSLSLAILKAVDLTDPAQLTPKMIMHFRMLFEAVFQNTDALVWNIFTRISALPELEMLRSSLVFFIKQYVVAANSGKSFAGKFKIAKKALDNVAGFLM